MNLDPPRPLGADGKALWDEFAAKVSDQEALLVLCEGADERRILRVRVIKGEDTTASDRGELRRLEYALAEQLEAVRRDASWQEALSW